MEDCPSGAEFSRWCSRGNNSATSSSTVTPLAWSCGLQELGTTFLSKALNQFLHILISWIGLPPGFFPESRDPELYLSASPLSWASQDSAITVELILHVEVAPWSIVPCHEVLINMWILVSFFFSVFPFFFLMPRFVFAKPSAVAHQGQGVLSSSEKGSYCSK